MTSRSGALGRGGPGRGGRAPPGAAGCGPNLNAGHRPRPRRPCACRRGCRAGGGRGPAGPWTAGNRGGHLAKPRGRSIPERRPQTCTQLERRWQLEQNEEGYRVGLQPAGAAAPARESERLQLLPLRVPAVVFVDRRNARAVDRATESEQPVGVADRGAPPESLAAKPSIEAKQAKKKRSGQSSIHQHKPTPQGHTVAPP